MHERVSKDLGNHSDCPGREDCSSVDLLHVEGHQAPLDLLLAHLAPNHLIHLGQERSQVRVLPLEDLGLGVDGGGVVDGGDHQAGPLPHALQHGLWCDADRPHALPVLHPQVIPHPGSGDKEWTLLAFLVACVQDHLDCPEVDDQLNLNSPEH